MTWTKLGSEFFPECLHTGMSDAAVRTHAEAIAYLYEVEESRLRIPKRLVRTFTGSDRFAEAIQELVEAGWWVDRDAAWEIVHHADVVRQSIAAQQTKRAVSKATSARHRAKKAESESANPSDGTTEVTRHVTPHTDRQTDMHQGSRSKETCEHGTNVQFWKCNQCEQKASA